MKTRITELFGISDVNYTNDLEYASAVLESMVKKKDKMKQDGSWDGAMAAIFGKKMPAEVEWFINNWGTIQDNLKEFDAEGGGYGLTSEELEDMNQLYLDIGRLEEKWKAFKESVTTKLFGKISLDMTAEAERGLDALAKIFNAETQEERDEAMHELQESILGMFEIAEQAIRDGVAILDGLAVELKDSENPIARTLGEVLGGLSEAIKWLTKDDAQNFKDALMIIAGVWGAAEVLKMVSTIGALAGNIATLKMAGGISALTNMLAGNGMATAGAAAGASWGAAFASAVLKAAPWLAALGIITHVSDTADDDLDSLWDKEGNPTQAGRDAGITWTFEEDQKMKESAEAIEEAAETLQESAEEVKEASEETAKVIDLTTKPYQPGSMQEADWRPSYMRGFGYDENIENVDLDRFDYTDQEKNDAVQDWWDAWREAADDEENSLEWMKEVFGDDFGTVWDTIMQRLDELGDKQMELDDLPADWWQTQGGNTGNTMTGDDAKSMTAAVRNMPGAVTKGLSGVKIYMDKTVVGSMVADEVSRQIATYVIG